MRTMTEAVVNPDPDTLTREIMEADDGSDR